jgi:hypothetical protein
MSRWKKVLWFLASAGLVACHPQTEDPLAEPGSTDPAPGAPSVPGGPVDPLPPVPAVVPAPSIPPGSAPAEPPAPAEGDELFAPDRLPRFDLEVSPEAIAELNAAEEAGDRKHYVRARFRYGDQSLEDVGIRLKGEASRTAFDQKPALKIKFDTFVRGRSFRGLRRLTLNNLFEDPTGIAERLTYHFFRLAGLPAPRANNALLYVNGAFYGVYANVESVDKAFVRRWFAQDGGNLYEEGGEDFLPGREDSFELQTNEMADDRSDLRALSSALAQAGDDTLLDALAPALDTEHFLRFTAVEGIVNQWDMYGYTRFYPNNFHLYSDPSRNKLVFLPWGMDMTWKPINEGAVHLPMLGLARRENQPAEEVTAGLIFQRCLAAAACKARYLAVVRELLALLESARLDQVAAGFRAQIAPHLRADTRKAFSDQQSETSYAQALGIIRQRAARIRAELGP